MEKRMFLAVGLSFLVILSFQLLSGPKSTGVQVRGGTQEMAPSGDIAPTIPPLTDVVKGSKPTFNEKTAAYNLGKFTLDISNNGGEVKRIFLRDLNYEFPINGLAEIVQLKGKQFSIKDTSNSAIILNSESNGFLIEKKITTDQYKIFIKYIVHNKLNQKNTFDYKIKPFEIDLSRLDNKVVDSDWTLFEYAIRTDKKINRKEHVNNFNEKWNKEESFPINWLSFRDRYFVTIVAPDNGFQGYSTHFLGKKNLSFNAEVPTVSLDPVGTATFSFTVYAGPQKIEDLKAARPGFEKVLVFSNWGWLDAIAKFIYWMLNVIHKIIPIWGLCIVIISLMVYGALYPLTLKSLLSMKKMQSVQPKIKILKEKFQNNPERLNKEIMELYKKDNINPLSGCLPLLLQMPIFVGLYQVLWRSFYFRGDGFLWIKDLSMPDRIFHLPFEIPFLGPYINILPILMTGIMFVQQKISMKSSVGADPEQMAQQKMMLVVMPIFLGVIFYNFSSGLNLYFVVFYSLSALSQWHINKGAR